MQNVNQIKREITLVLDILPLEGLTLLAEFVAFLRLKFGLGQKPVNEQGMLNIDQDPIVGLFVASPDLASQSEEILQQNITAKSGWTWKETL